MKKTDYHIIFTIISIAFSLQACQQNGQSEYDVIVVGGGASGVMAGIQAARMEKSVLIIEETEWFGGMFTSAGVSAIDGNYKLASGLWEEFRKRVTNYYSGEENVKTGWVSNVMFEPQVGASILDSMVAEANNINAIMNSRILDVKRMIDRWNITFETGDQIQSTTGKILIDATELGDIAGMLNIPYTIGMDSRYDTGEEIAPIEANDIIQDLTYVAILEKADDADPPTLTKPDGYNPEIFRCTCAGFCDPETISRTLWPCDQMMEYGRLPNDQLMVNWPIYGNDYYVNAIEMSREEREEAFEKAKNFTRCYIYYLQTELGFDDWRISNSIFPTADGFPMIPYHRESRRVEGMVRFDVNDLAEPYGQEDDLYKTGIAVGDYPVDHHHAAYPESENLPDLHFYPVPSYTLPLGTLIPKEGEGLIVAEKSISVTNIVNGTTRLQPVCMLIGQAAGILASLSIDLNVPLNEVPVRRVQQGLLDAKAFILPYADVFVDDAEWKTIQKIGATGLLKGEGRNIGWRNYTFFHPDTVVSKQEILENLNELDLFLEMNNTEDQVLSVAGFLEICNSLDRAERMDDEALQDLWMGKGWGSVDIQQSITRREAAVLLDHLLNPFDWDVDHRGNLLSK